MSTPTAVFASARDPALVLASAPAPAPAQDQAQSQAPVQDQCPQAALLRLPQLPRITCFACRAMTSFLFTTASSIVSLVMVAVSCTMSVRSLAEAVAKFAMASTCNPGLWWRYVPHRRGHPSRFESIGATPCGWSQKTLRDGGVFCIPPPACSAPDNQP